LWISQIGGSSAIFASKISTFIQYPSEKGRGCHLPYLIPRSYSFIFSSKFISYSTQYSISYQQQDMQANMKSVVSASAMLLWLATTAQAQGEDYDFIIVGGGTAGCVMANRLCQALPGARIALFEAGAMRTPEQEANVRVDSSMNDSNDLPPSLKNHSLTHPITYLLSTYMKYDLRSDSTQGS
jgi:hypothetical protein